MSNAYTDIKVGQKYRSKKYGTVYLVTKVTPKSVSLTYSLLLHGDDYPREKKAVINKDHFKLLDMEEVE